MMTTGKTAIVVLAAGLGTRMKSRMAKVMHPIAGRPMIRHLLASLETLSPDPLVVVVGEEMQAVRGAVAPYPAVVQKNGWGPDTPHGRRGPPSQGSRATS